MIKPITRKEYNSLLQMVKDALKLASTHGPEHEQRLGVLERQMQRIGGAPQYRLAAKGAVNGSRRRV